jgi:DNA-binding CsgD family transcriptional regulator
MLDAHDLADLVTPLIDGIVEEPPWTTFLERLRRRLDSGYASLVFRPFPEGTPQNRLIHLYAGQRWTQAVDRLYRERLGGSDPLPYHELREGRVYTLSELLRSDDPAHHFYRTELLAPSGMNVMRMMRFEEPGGVSGWITVSRREGEFDASDESLIAALAPYLRAALRSFVALERERMNATVANEAISRLNFGWITLDAQGAVAVGFEHGEALLAAGTMLQRGRAGRLTARDPQVSAAIRAAIADLAGDPATRPRAVVLSREPWLDMLLVPAQLRPAASGPAPALVAYVHSDSWSSADRCEQLGELFDLIPCEARLALALSRGMTIAEAADELGLTVESARTYSKRIYAKTGARGQPDLLRFIHRSVLAIA